MEEFGAAPPGLIFQLRINESAAVAATADNFKPIFKDLVLMTSTFTAFELFAQGADLFDAAFHLSARIEYDLRSGVFDGDPAARAQAEAMLADVRRFYSELLKPYSNDTTPSARRVTLDRLFQDRTEL